MMNKKLALLFICIALVGLTQAQGGADATIVTDSDRSVEEAHRLRVRPTRFDTVIPSPKTNYPLLVLQAETRFEIQKIEPATLRHRPQLSQLYNGYAKVGGGNRLMGLGEVYYTSTRSRKYNWGVHALHLSEWGQISDYAPSQYDRTKATAYGEVRENRYSYGGEIGYINQGLHYYGFENPNASRDSIAQRFNALDFNGYYASHPKDSAAINYRLGLDYSYFNTRKPSADTLRDWRTQEHFVALRSEWQYKGSNHFLLSNMKADANVLYNDYRFGVIDSTIPTVGHGREQRNTLIHLRPTTHFYSKNEKFQFALGLDFTTDITSNVNAFLYPVAQVQYSLFNDLFIPYVGVDGGVQQQRFAHLAFENEFIQPSVPLRNQQHFDLNAGIKGTLSKKMSFNVGVSFSNNRNLALFVNDTLFSAGNRFDVIYDTATISSLYGSLSYQYNEKIKIDGIVRLHSYQLRNNPYAWNLPQAEWILRGNYNVANKLYVKLDFVLEAGRRALVTDPTIPNVQTEDGISFVPLGLIADGNLGVEYRYTPRVSFFGNLNNFAAQRYQRWFNYPVQAFQFMLGATFKF